MYLSITQILKCNFNIVTYVLYNNYNININILQNYKIRNQLITIAFKMGLVLLYKNIFPHFIKYVSTMIPLLEPKGTYQNNILLQRFKAKIQLQKLIAYIDLDKLYKTYTNLE